VSTTANHRNSKPVRFSNRNLFFCEQSMMNTTSGNRVMFLIPGKISFQALPVRGPVLMRLSCHFFITTISPALPQGLSNRLIEFLNGLESL